jgi:hypothetical protein
MPFLGRLRPRQSNANEFGNASLGRLGPGWWAGQQEAHDGGAHAHNSGSYDLERTPAVSARLPLEPPQRAGGGRSLTQQRRRQAQHTQQ